MPRPDRRLARAGASRCSPSRWRTLSGLLAAVERAVNTSAKLDAHAPRAASERQLRAYDRRLRTLEARVDAELDRLTVEWLRASIATQEPS